jgi:hypothetical protein
MTNLSLAVSNPPRVNEEHLQQHAVLAVLSAYETQNYRRQIDVKYLVSSKSASKCSGSVSKALRYLTASFILLGGLEGRSGHLPKERLVFLQKSMCSGVLSRAQEHFNSAVSCLNLLWYHAKSLYCN